MMTYDDYLSGGGTLPEQEVLSCVTEADGIIRRHTFGRLDGAEPLPAPAKFLLVALTDLLYGNRQRTGIVSETSDGVSVTFAQGGQDVEIRSLVANYLSEVKVKGVPVLYRGV